MYNIENFITTIAPIAGVKADGVTEQDFEQLFEYDTKQHYPEFGAAIYEYNNFPVAYYNPDEYLGYYIQ